VQGRGDRSVIEIAPGEELANDYSMNVADICPVGALTTKDFRFKIRVWFLDEVPGVCTGCANGCNIHLGVANNRVYRYVPRRNDAVNDTWMCDEGRLSYKEIGAPDRLAEPQVRDAEGRLVSASLDAALETAAGRIRSSVEASGPGVVVALASPHATNEDLFTLRSFLAALGTASAAGVAVRRGRADDLLIKAEKAANATGARALGFGEPGPVLDRIRGGGARVLIALGHDVLDPAFGADEASFRALDTVILIDTHHSVLERVAHVVLPARVAAEKLGTLTNHAARVQRVVPAVEPAHQALAEGDLLWRIGQRLGLPGFAPGAWEPREVSKAIGEAVPAFRGIDVDSVGPDGKPLGDAGAPA
jgi:NADH-quinone oxidoreductase subunit G